MKLKSNNTTNNKLNCQSMSNSTVPASTCRRQLNAKFSECKKRSRAEQLLTAADGGTTWIAAHGWLRLSVVRSPSPRSQPARPTHQTFRWRKGRSRRQQWCPNTWYSCSILPPTLQTRPVCCWHVLLLKLLIYYYRPLSTSTHIKVIKVKLSSTR